MVQTAQAPQAAQPSMSRHRMGKVNVMHNSVVQKLKIEAAWIQGLPVPEILFWSLIHQFAAASTGVSCMNPLT